MGAPILDNILSRLASTLQSRCTTTLVEPNPCHRVDGSEKGGNKENAVLVRMFLKYFFKNSVNSTLFFRD